MNNGVRRPAEGTMLKVLSTGINLVKMIQSYAKQSLSHLFHLECLSPDHFLCLRLLRLILPESSHRLQRTAHDPVLEARRSQVLCRNTRTKAARWPQRRMSHQPIRRPSRSIGPIVESPLFL